MKKLLAVILILSLFLSLCSCNQETEVSLTPTPATPTPVATNLPIYTGPEDDGTINIYSIALPYMHMFKEDADAWEDYILTKYDVPVNLEYITYEHSSGLRGVELLEADLGVKVDELRYLKSHNGFVVITSMYDLVKLMDSGLITPVNDVISDIPAYSDLPPHILDSYTDKNGEIWALPTSDKINLTRRIYNKEWLDAYGKGIPSNIDEFYEYARFVRFEDPDGNGVDDTYIANTNNYSILRTFGDIFASMGCKHIGHYPWTYDPDDEKYISICETQEFHDAMAIIKLLLDEGLIKEEFDMYGYSNNPYEYDYKVASVMGYSYYPEFFNGYEIGELWGPYFDNNKLPVWTDFRCLAVLKDTADIADKFNSLYGIACCGTEGVMDLYAGMEEKTYDIEDGYVNFKTLTYDGGYNPRVNINFGLAIDDENGINIVYNNSQTTLDLLESGRLVQSEIDALNRELLSSSSSLYSVPLLSGADKLWNIRIYSMTPYYSMVNRSLEGKNTIANEAVAYNNNLVAYGVIDMLDEINTSD